MNDRLKVGVFGVGSLGQHHARIYSEMDEVELAGVHDIDGERSNEIATRFGTTSCERMEDLASQIGAASVVVPTDRHHEVSSLLMEHGVHLLVEKPIASTTAEAESLVALAGSRHLILQVGHVERFNPVMKFLEDNLARPRFIEVIRLGTYPPPRDNNVPRGTEVSVVLDLMIHDLEIILHIVRDEVKQIHAIGVPVLSPTEDIANVRLAFRNGCVANVTASRISQEKMRKIRVFQHDTYVSLDYMNQAGQICRKTDGDIVPGEIPIEKGEPLPAELTSFVRCVINRDSPIVSGKHASEALKLAVEICRQIRKSPS